METINNYKNNVLREVKENTQKYRTEFCEKTITQSNKKCEYCGTPYQDIRISCMINGIKQKPLTVTEPTCDCLARMEKEKAEKVRIDAEIRRKREQTPKLFENSMMTPFFMAKRFENLEQTDEIIYCKRYANNFIPQESKGIQMFGNPGTGKTTTLAAICNDLILRDYNCLFTPLSTLLDKFSSFSYLHSGDITELLQWLTAFDFVVLDDIGRETYTDKRKENVFRIIDTLMNYRVVTAFTANPEMIIKLKSIPELNAALDRLKEMCPIKFEFRGESYRGRGV